MIKVSVIIPTYNSEKTITRTLDSVISQEGINELFTVQILICDDRSTDNTRIIAYNSLKFSSERIGILSFVNDKNSGGPNWGRNTGLSHATGDVVCFLDHDDTWLPDKLIKQLEQINKGYEFIYSRCIKEVE